MKKFKQKGFTFVEMIFWLAVIALIVGGFIYKYTKQIHQTPSNQNQKKEGGIFGGLKSETDNKQKLIDQD